MRKPDLAHRRTDKILSDLERRIADEFRIARDELQDKIDDYFEKFKKRDAEQLARLQAGEITTEQYKQWRFAQIGRGKRFEALRDRVAERMTNANEVATAYINDTSPGIYSLNRNYAAYTIEAQVGADVGFDLWDEQTVKRLIVEQPDLMPYYPPKRAVKRGIDLAWGKKQITAQVTTGILQGESIKHLADRLQKNIPDMNRNSAIRAARTAVTGAQNAGRLDSYFRAEEMGISLQKRWLATLDNRTRHAHAHADGQVTKNDLPFIVGGEELMFPGDGSCGASGWNLYNCRCTMIAEVEDVPKDPNPIRIARDPETGRNIMIPDMTYAQWESWKKSENRYVWETYKKMGRNASSDRKQFEEYKKLLGKEIPKTFADFQKMKYNEPDRWAFVKSFGGYKRRVPEAEKNDFEKYVAVKKTGIIGIIRVPPAQIDVSKLEFNDSHGMHHGCTLEEARSYVENSLCSISRQKWDGISVNYYSRNGATYINPETMKIKTSFPMRKFDQMIKAIMEVFQ